MNKKLISAVGVFAIVLLIVGILFINSKKTSLSPQAINTAAEQQEDVMVAKEEKKSLKELFSLGIPQQCSVSLMQDGVSTNGKLYITKDKLRGDIESTIDGVKTTSYILILDNSESYIWQDNSKDGFKMSLDKLDNSSEQKTPLDFNQPGEYSCSVWIPSEDKFTLPNNVKFTDMSSLMPNPSSTDNCFVCNSLTGAEKNQCLSALKCAN